MTDEHWQENPRNADPMVGESSRHTPWRRAVDLIALSRAITFSGGNAAYIALLVVLYRETNSPVVVALGALAAFAVPALVSPVAGWLGDRFDRRRVMVTSELLGAGCFLLSAAVASSPVELLVLRVFASLAAAPFLAATAASLPGIVKSRDQLPAANAKLVAAGICGGLIGPLLAAGLLLVSGPASVFLFNALTFVISAALLLSIDGDFLPARRKESQGRLSQLAAGFRYLGHHPLLGPVTLSYGLIFVGVGLTTPAAEVALSSDFGVGATGFATLTCVFALGGLAGTRFARHGLLSLSIEPTAILAAASGLLGLGFLTVGFSPAFAVALAGMAVVGIADGAWLVAHENVVQRVTPDAIRSRVFASGEAVYLGGLAVGTIAAGALVSSFGAAGTFRVGAVGSLLSCAILALTATSIAKKPLPRGPAGGRRGLRPRRPSPTAAALLPPTEKQLRRAADGTG